MALGRLSGLNYFRIGLALLVLITIRAALLVRVPESPAPPHADKLNPSAEQSHQWIRDEPAPQKPATESTRAANGEQGADFAAAIAVHILRSSLRDPDSLVLESVYSRVPAMAVCMEYRAKNGFGGVNRERAAFYNLQLSKSASVWNRYCAGSGFRNVVLSNLEIYEQLIQSNLR